MSIKLLLVTVAGFALGAASGFSVLPEARNALIAKARVHVVGEALIGGAFQLVDHTGKRVTDKDFRGRYMLVQFGFTFCPDVCPTGLQLMSAALAELGPLAARVTPVFISVDHERDTPEVLGKYVTAFHPRIVGLTGSADDIRNAARAYRVYFAKVKDPSSGLDYSYDHSAITYLMDRNGKYVAHFPLGISVNAMTKRLRAHIQR
jgi:protein SCO1/2